MAVSIKDELVSDLMQIVEELEKSAAALRDAMIEHKVEDIWAAIAVQERVLGELEKIKAKIETSVPDAPPGQTSSAFGEARGKLKKLFEKVCLIQGVNRRLAGIYLDVVEKTFSRFSDATRAKGLTYGATGNIERMTVPMFVQQTG